MRNGISEQGYTDSLAVAGKLNTPQVGKSEGLSDNELDNQNEETPITSEDGDGSLAETGEKLNLAAQAGKEILEVMAVDAQLLLGGSKKCAEWAECIKVNAVLGFIRANMIMTDLLDNPSMRHFSTQVPDEPGDVVLFGVGAAAVYGIPAALAIIDYYKNKNLSA